MDITQLSDLLSRSTSENFVNECLEALLKSHIHHLNKNTQVDLSGFETVWGVAMPADLNKMFSLFNQYGWPEFGNFQSGYNSGMYFPTIKNKEANTFEAFAKEDGGDWICSNFRQLLGKAICIGNDASGNWYLFSLDESEPHVLVMEHMYGRIEVIAADSLGSFLMHQVLMEYVAKLPDDVFKNCVEKLRGHLGFVDPAVADRAIHLGVHTEDYAFVPEFSTSNYLAIRSGWLLPLISGEGFSWIRDLYDPAINDVKESFNDLVAPGGSVSKYSSSALYLLLRSFYFDEADWFARVLPLCKEHASMIVRDAATWLEQALAKKVKQLGSTPDILTLRQELWGLRLVPHKSLESTTLELALQDVHDTDRSPLMQLIERRLPDFQFKNDKEEAIAIAKKFTDDDACIQALVACVADSLTLPRFYDIDAIATLQLMKPAKGLDGLIPVLTNKKADPAIKRQIARLLGDVRYAAAMKAMIEYLTTLPANLDAMVDPFKKSQEILVAMAVVHALGRSGDASAIPAVDALFDYSDWDLKKVASLSLAQLKAPNAVERMLNLSKAWGSIPDATVAWAFGIAEPTNESQKNAVIEALDKVATDYSQPCALVARHVLSKWGIADDKLESDTQQWRENPGSWEGMGHWLNIITHNILQPELERINGKDLPLWWK